MRAKSGVYFDLSVCHKCEEHCMISVKKRGKSNIILCNLGIYSSASYAPEVVRMNFGSVWNESRCPYFLEHTLMVNENLSFVADNS